jgi:hypothetical protein
MAEARLTTWGAYARIGRLWLSWAPSLLLLALVVFIPVGLIHSVTIAADIGEIEFGGIVELLGTAIALIALAITGLLGEVFYTGAVAQLMTGEYEDREPPSLREIAGEIEYARLIAVDVIYGVAVAVGLVLLIAPGVAAYVFLALAAPVIEIERHGVRASIRRSIRLVRGRFWIVLAVLVPLELAGSALTALLTRVPHDLFGDSLLSHWLADVLSNLATTPFYAVAAVLLTVTLIREKDGTAPRLHSSPGS